ncbi:MAG: redox-sensing transcriptional repressor Rex [Limnochordaceae bacterium]|nr:redox-sensing transcriptional repressor Rex [Limnochordaceae bacterium]
MPWPKIADAVVRRLVIYLRVLDEEARQRETTISSYRLAEKTGVSPALVRKDLAWFGEFGTRGVGYDVAYLRDELHRILNTSQEVRAALVGSGSLGVALTRYNIRRFASDRTFNVNIVALFDTDPGKIGLKIDGVEIYPLSRLQERVKALGITMGIVTVPAYAAQDVVSQLVAAGVQGVLNFAPTPVQVPPGIALQTADLSLEMQYLAYTMTRRLDKDRDRNWPRAADPSPTPALETRTDS